jgi:hypothetical protein
VAKISSSSPWSRNTLSLRCFLNLRDTKFHTHKTTDKIITLWIAMFSASGNTVLET